MNTRQRFHAIMDFQPFDRLPILEWASWWDKTVERWRTEGLPNIANSRLATHFGLDEYLQDWIPPFDWAIPRPPHGSGYISDETGYQAITPHLFQLTDIWPVNPDKWQRLAARQASGNAVVWFTLEGFFWLPRRLLGIEPHLYAFYDQPHLMHRINAENTAWMLKVIDRICEFCTPDFMTFAEDLSYNNGPMLSHDLFNEFMLPYYQQIVPHLRRRGIRTIIDTDGDVTAAVGWFADAGLEGILPLERQAGVDLATIRRDFPQMRFIGHYDKMVMNRGETAMRAEFERLLPLARQGGFLPSCDHQTPPGVSLSQYHDYLRLFREYAFKAAAQEPNAR
ncbi:MAG: hypothetical protein GX230_11600 [Lentisphaerae bacterium]|nr:hypothetical protein [Lentisphaerota bacterium]